MEPRDAPHCQRAHLPRSVRLPSVPCPCIRGCQLSDLCPLFSPSLQSTRSRPSTPFAPGYDPKTGGAVAVAVPVPGREGGGPGGVLVFAVELQEERACVCVWGGGTLHCPCCCPAENWLVYESPSQEPTPAPHLFIGLANDILTRVAMDAVTGLLTDPRSRSSACGSSRWHPSQSAAGLASSPCRRGRGCATIMAASTTARL